MKEALTQARYRAKKGGVEVSLTSDDLVEMWAAQDGRCAISGMPLTHHRRGSGDSAMAGNSLTNGSIDRINPRGDYVIDNVHLVCSGVNLMRRGLELDEFLTWCRQVADHQSRQWRG